ncbi:MAG: 4Fe-4S binding protein [Alphaproteobacteria bacterium]|jgi:pyruvate ferredoxin oxidoreductase gamma subunit|nr:4Fe-4S binding protein [Alphaproteobacteria bacterium]MBT4017067.1 4Fe-4S binding protein [Alphaproteobacteria bacterium]MBT5159757.1 4Fe-4S binding protein [Alphaproteobacteria bacterium]MBT5919756.1 4Fe-4S binding protein [Alphaproteobacteria bacterium]MBT6384423.1 4Fe-4S binding protein [Alphaproteobacteria bacterium]
MYRIRFHGRGGQGMKTASRILGTALFRGGFQVQDAPRYGAERRGAPMFAFVRAAREPILERGIITNPDLVLVADDSLVGIPAAGVMAGLRTDTVLAIASDTDADTWRHRLHINNPVVILPGIDTDDDDTHIPDTSAQCAGAAAALIGKVSRVVLTEAVTEETSGFGALALEANLETALAAFDAIGLQTGSVVEGAAYDVASSVRPDWVDLSAEASAVAAPNIYAALTSVQVRTGLWRTLRPLLERDKCKRCHWVCGSYCPDGVIAVDDAGYPEIDYEHCKGCMICVAQCPAHALVAVAEEEYRTAKGDGA